MTISKDAEIEQLRALLARCIKYAREDRMVTPGVTRLARALAEGETLLAEISNAGGVEQVTQTLDGPTLTSNAPNADSDGPAPAPAEEAASGWTMPRTNSASEIAARIRKRLKDEPSVAQRVMDAIADICECGGSMKHDEHAEGCPLSTSTPASAVDETNPYEEMARAERDMPPEHDAVWWLEHVVGRLNNMIGRDWTMGALLDLRDELLVARADWATMSVDETSAAKSEWPGRRSDFVAWIRAWGTDLTKLDDPSVVLVGEALLRVAREVADGRTMPWTSVFSTHVPTRDDSVCSHCDRGVIDVPGPITAEVCPWCKGNYRAPPPAVDEASVERIAERLRNVFAFPANFTARLVAGDGVAGALPILVAAAHSPEIIAAIQRVAAEVRRG